MNAKKLERDACVAVLAMYRSSSVEGITQLTRADIADRVGYKDIGKLRDSVLKLMIDKAWIVPISDGFELTPPGRIKAEEIIAGMRQGAP